jgi:gamma-glutamylaminecyclotransferase
MTDGAPANDAAGPTRVFVYGTLLAGEGNHALLQTARFIGAARTPPGFGLYDLGAFPGLVRGGQAAVVGEVYEVDAPTLAALDDLEDHPTFYQRTIIVLEDGSVAATYLLSARCVVH